MSRLSPVIVNGLITAVLAAAIGFIVVALVFEGIAR